MKLLKTTAVLLSIFFVLCMATVCYAGPENGNGAVDILTKSDLTDLHNTIIIGIVVFALIMVAVILILMFRPRQTLPAVVELEPEPDNPEPSPDWMRSGAKRIAKEAVAGIEEDLSIDIAGELTDLVIGARTASENARREFMRVFRQRLNGGSDIDALIDEAIRLRVRERGAELPPEVLEHATDPTVTQEEVDALNAAVNTEMAPDPILTLLERLVDGQAAATEAIRNLTAAVTPPPDETSHAPDSSGDAG
ncbi:MAG: hypothetical protein ABIF08_02420 [Nanoarchaeota archaeon]